MILIKDHNYDDGKKEEARINHINRFIDHHFFAFHIPYQPRWCLT